MDDQIKKFRDALEKAGLTDKKLLNKVDELIKAIETGEYKPKNKEKELKWLRSQRISLLKTIKDKNS
ncbi:MAG TPA: hypothetical protein VMR41_00120 [Patescibacteria group bacterium]|nr:hypothetical protein [Patescibacteria group bacterium]